MKRRFAVISKHRNARQDKESTTTKQTIKTHNKMKISNSIKQLSTQGIINILSGHPHVNVDSCENRQELQETLQINIDENLIDEIEIILELSGE